MDPAREVYWQTKLRSLRLHAEPVEAQVGRLRAATLVLSGVVSGIGLMILAIFAGFGRADVGLAIDGLVFIPAVLWFWLDYAILRRRASAYLREREEADALRR